MATQIENREVLSDNVTYGPGLVAVKLILDSILDGRKNEVISIFGGFRQYPIRITGFNGSQDPTDSPRITIYGVLDYRNCNPAFHKLSGKRVAIVNYSLHNFHADCIKYI